MRNFLARLILVMLCLGCVPAFAQSSGKVVADCTIGVPLAYALGSNSVPTILPTGANCVSASVSASITGFPTTQTAGTPISVTTSSGAGTLPSGTVVVVSNVGATNGAYCKLGATATTSDQLIPPNSWFAFTVGAATQLACITSTSTTTVNMVGGSGLPTGSGGGGGGGSGGAATIADGADVAEGAIADAAVTAGATGTVSAKLRAISRDIATVITNTAAAIPAQANNTTNIGGVTNAGKDYETIAASQTGQTMGPTGGTGDYLSHCVIYPTSTSPGVLTVFDSTSSATNNVITFAGGASSLSNLSPVAIPVGAVSVNGAWKVTTGANMVVTCHGKFT